MYMNSWLSPGVFTSKKPQNYVEAVEALERSATETKGASLASLVTSWCEALENLHPKTCLKDIDSECPIYQQHSLGGQSLNRKPSSQQLYVEDGQKDPISFRALFLRSQALEKLLESCLHNPGTPVDVWEGIHRLLLACLEGNTAPIPPASIVGDLQQLAEACSIHKSRIATSKTDLIDATVDAISSLKVRADVEYLEAQIEGLKSEVVKVAPATENGSSHLSNEFDIKKAQNGVSAAKKKWKQGCNLWNLAGQRNAFLSDAMGRESQFQDVTRLLNGQLRMVQESHEMVDKKIAQAKVQYDEQSGKRNERMVHHNEHVERAEKEVKRLQYEKQRLEEMLEKVKNDLESAMHQCAEVVEDRHVFEEGESLSLEGLMHQTEELREEAVRHSGEEKAVVVTKSIIEELGDFLSGHLVQGREFACGLQELCEGWCYKSAETYCSSLHNEAQLTLRQLQFCQEELNNLLEKQEHIMEIGMQSMIADVDRSRAKLQNKYLQSESTAEELFSEANSVKKKVLSLASHPQYKFALKSEGSANCHLNGTIPQDPSSSTEDIAEALMSCDLTTQNYQLHSDTSAPTPELGNIFQKLSDLESEYRCLERPVGLPDSIEQWSDSADDSSFESVSPAAGVRSAMQSMVNEPAVWNEKISKS